MDRWRDPGNLESVWEPRSEFAARLIPRNTTVLDIGCGKMTVERYLHPTCKYIPVDIVSRDERTIVCDVNKGELPGEIKNADIVLMLGLIEYIFDLPSFLKAIERYKKKVIVSYCDTDRGPHKTFEQRAPLGWVNAFSVAELVSIFEEAGFKVTAVDNVDQLQAIYTLTPRSNLIQQRRVGVLSYSNVGNFGDRLGVHVLSSIMPSNAVVDYLYFKPWPNITCEYDLLVLGIGNSIFAPLLTDQLFALVRSAKSVIGIFGTQYRNEYPQDRMIQLIRSLDHWFARYEDDLELYGQSNNHSFHLGDWLIREFTPAAPADERLLVIDNSIWRDLPLDRTIQMIRRHKRVHSERVHPLLCALMSAEVVAYKEQRESGTGNVSGKFGSMLHDVFGRTFPENTEWTVDRDSVIRYRRDVQMRISHLEKVLTNMLS